MPTGQELTGPSSKMLSIEPANSVEAAILETKPFPKADSRQAASAAAMLIGCYPNGKPADPQTYVAAITALLAEFPHEVVRRVTDPRFGVQRHCKFLPTIAELSDALEVEMVPLRRQWREEKIRREEEIERQIRARALPDAQAEKRIVEGLKKLSAELDHPMPVLDKSAGPLVAKPISNHASRVLADMARRKADNPRDEAAE